MLVRRAAEALGQLGDVLCVHQRVWLNAEHRVRELHRTVPVARIGQCLCFQHKTIVQLLDRRVRGPAAKAEAQPLLQRIDQNQEVLYVAGKAPPFRRLDPGPQPAHGQGVPAERGALAFQFVEPSPAELEVGLSHLAQPERHGDVPHFVALAPLHLHALLGMDRGPLHDVQHAAERRAFHLDAELGVVRVARVECLG